jgi:hypothetical protein
MGCLREPVAQRLTFGNVFALVFGHSLDSDCFAAERVGQQPLQETLSETDIDTLYFSNLGLRNRNFR